MLTHCSEHHQTNLFGTDLLIQLDPTDPLLQLAAVIPWKDFDKDFAQHYSENIGAGSKPIRLMVGLLMLKTLEDLSDESVVVQWKRNAYYQAFCGMTEFQKKVPCHSTELVHFRKRIGLEGYEKIFQMSIALHGKAALENEVNIDTTVHDCMAGIVPTILLHFLHPWRSMQEVERRTTAWMEEVERIRRQSRGSQSRREKYYLPNRCQACYQNH